MKVLCAFGRHQYGDPERGISTEYRAFVPALERNGHEVVVFDTWDKRPYASLADLNLALLEAVEAQKPDVLWFVPMVAEVWLETLEAIRERGDVALVCWTTDDSWKYVQQSRFIAPLFHTITTTYPTMVSRYRADGIDHVMLTQWGASAADLHEPLPAADCRHQVTFVGAMHGNRQKRVEALRQHGVDVECFGHGWPSGSVPAERMTEIIRASVISLNFANSQGDNQIKARVFEVPGAGGFLLTEHAPGIERYYDVGGEIDTFTDMAELARKIESYLADPSRRDDMARRAYERTAREHTYDVRVRDILAHALAARDEWNRSGRKNQAPSLEAALRRHRVGAGGRVLRALLLAFTVPIWGRRRGRRAARRLLYEISWRVAGARTYSAAGLPGRLFPKD